MAFNAFPTYSNVPELWTTHIKVTGTGAAALTLDIGPGVTIARVSAGLHTITWGDNPGTFVGYSWAFGAATPADIEDHSVVFDDYASNAVQFTIYDGTPAVDDLEASEYLYLQVHFKQTAV